MSSDRPTRAAAAASASVPAASPSPEGDQAFRASGNRERWPDAAYAGALSFLRRRYTESLDDVDVAVCGIPWDGAVTYRSGCRLGPRAIRAASVQLTELMAYPSGIDVLSELAIVDRGDVLIDPHHPDTVIGCIEDYACQVIDSGALMATLGGDHFISYPLLRAHAQRHGPVALVQFDAHCDTWDDNARALDHGVMFGRAAAEGLIDTARSTQVGLRTWNDTDAGFQILSSPWIHRNGIDAAIQAVRERAGDAPLYLSFDVDGLDPAYAPGTGTPVAGGLASWQALEFVRGLAGLNLIGMDVVEVSPAYDHAEITALAAATVVHDWLVCVAMNRGATSPASIGAMDNVQ